MCVLRLHFYFIIFIFDDRRRNNNEIWIHWQASHSILIHGKSSAPRSHQQCKEKKWIAVLSSNETTKWLQDIPWICIRKHSVTNEFEFISMAYILFSCVFFPCHSSAVIEPRPWTTEYIKMSVKFTMYKCVATAVVVATHTHTPNVKKKSVFNDRSAKKTNAGRRARYATIMWLCRSV